MSHLRLRYSEGYDASISGWTGTLDETYFNDHYDDWMKGYVEPAQGYVAQAQTTWDAINDPVFDAFRSVGYQFLDLWPAYGVHRWPGVVGFKDPLTFLLDDPADDLIVLLTHELVHCHEDFPANRQIYEKVKAHSFERFAGEPIAVRYHLITVCVQWFVLRLVFPERYPQLIGLTCRHPLLKRCAEILNNSGAAVDESDPLDRFLKL